MIDRTIPHDSQAERALLGAMLLHRDAIGAATEECQAEDFHSPAHASIFEAICALDTRNVPVDQVTLANELARRGASNVEGTDLLSMMVDAPGTWSVAGHHARIVSEMATLRRLFGVSAELRELALSMPTDVDETVDEAEARVFALRNARNRRGIARVDGAAMHEFLDTFEARITKTGPTGVSTGWHDLDDMTLGLHPGQLVVVAARTSMGKSSFSAALAASAARNDGPVLLVSAEMSRGEIMDRLVAAEAGVALHGLRRGTLSEVDVRRVTQAVSAFDGVPLYINDDASSSLLSIRGEARRVARREGRLSLIIVDYLQLLTPPQEGRRNDNRQVEVAALSRGLKRLALELGVPVVALSQLNRELEHRSDKRPMLADLRESGAIENDADVVMFLYRDEVYKADSPDRGIAEVIVAKQRNGPTGTVYLAFDAARGSWRNMRRMEAG